MQGQSIQKHSSNSDTISVSTAIPQASHPITCSLLNLKLQTAKNFKRFIINSIYF